MSDFVITAENVKNGCAYVPIMEKERIVGTIAEHCLEAVQIAVQLGNGKQNAVPALFRPNYGLKQRFILGILLKRYLNCEFQPCESTEYLMSADEYDRWAEHHPISTLERLKAEKDIRDKVYDLLYDYKELEKRLTAAIYDECQMQNDAVIRAYAVISESLDGIATPEMLQAQLNELKGEYSKFLEGRE